MPRTVNYPCVLRARVGRGLYKKFNELAEEQGIGSSELLRSVGKNFCLKSTQKDAIVVKIFKRRLKMENALTVIHQQNVLGQNFQVYGTIQEPLFLAKDVVSWIEHSDVGVFFDGAAGDF